MKIKSANELKWDEKEHEESYRMLFDANPNPVLIFDYNTLGFLAVNDAAINLYDYSREEFLQLTIMDIRPEEDIPLVSEIVRDGNFKEIGIWRHRKKNGQIIWVKITAQPMDWQDHRAVVVRVHDISESKRTEDYLHTALQQLQFHENNSPLGVIQFNDQFQVTKWSKKAEDLFGWKAEEVIGKNLDQFRWVHEDDLARVGELINAMLASTRTSNCHTNRNYRKDGSVITCEWYNSALVDSKGKLISVHSFVLDVTERLQQEAELIEAKEKAEENDRLKTSFLANMSHEIRTPLNSIIGFSELLTDPDYDSSQQFQIARMIYFSGHNLLAIINNILEISEIEAGQVHLNKEMFSINQLMINVQKEYLFKSIEKGIELYVEPSHLKLEVFMEGDEIKTRNILSRIVGNALKFTKEGSIKLGFKTMGDFVQFSVKDTGIGISEEYHGKIFERFRQVESSNTRKYGGNGLGLAISKGLVELMGGIIWMESQKGKGSTFYFKIPLR